MAEYIDRDKAFDAVDKRIDELKGDKQFNIVKEIDVSGVKRHILNVPIADVVEREKIDKAIEEINNIDLNEYADNSYQLVNECIDILKRNIGE